MNFNLSRWALNHQGIILYFMILFAILGVHSYLTLGQSEDPPFTFRVMVINTQWPGASAEEVEAQVTDRIEEKLQESANLDYMRSYSRPGESQVFFIVREDIDPALIPDAYYEVRKKVGDIRHTLPEGVVGPFFNDEFGDTFGNMFALTGPDFSPAELEDYAERVRTRLLRIPDVAKVMFFGVQPQTIEVRFANTKRSQLGVPPEVIIEAVQGANRMVPSGYFEMGQDRIYLRTNNQLETAEQVRQLAVSYEGRTVRVGDVAEVVRGYADPAAPQARFGGEPAIAIGISMEAGGDILRLGRALSEAYEELQQTLPLGLTLHRVSDQSEVVQRGVNEFVKVLAEAVVIVLLVSFFSLGLRTGLVVALSIPLVLAMTFLSMKYFGIDLHKISLGALVLALGLLVDDAIIAVEMMAIKIEQGWDRAKAAAFMYTSTAFPMLTGTLVTAAGFLPIGIAESSTGEYTRSIFQVVGLSLMISWLAAVMFVPYLGYKLLPERPQGAHHDPYQTRFYQRFRALVKRCVDHRWVVIVITVALFFGSVGLFRLVPQQFFPASVRLELMVDLKLPEGASLTATQAVAQRLETVLRDTPELAADIDSFIGYVGSGAPRYYLPLDQQLPAPSFTQYVITTTGIEARERLRAALVQRMPALFPDARWRVLRLEAGPPVGYPVQFRVAGEDTAVLHRVADQVAEQMRQNPNAANVHLDWVEPSKVIRIDVDRDRAQALGVSAESVANYLQGSLLGLPVTQVRDGVDSVNVLFRGPPQDRAHLSLLASTAVPTAFGGTIPLDQIATLGYDREYGITWRRDRLPTVTVRADVYTGVQAPVVTAQVRAAIADIEAALPVGYHITAGGSVEESAKGQNSVNKGMPVFVIAVLTLLIFQLKRFSLVMMVVLTAPLGIIGVALFLLLLQAPFGFVAMLGTIALSGMIMRNSVILVDQIEHDIAAGASAYEAIVEATVRRFRPIVLTALAAVLAMIPLSRSVFFGPMAVAIMGGLIAATGLTLLFLPALYAAWFRVRREPVQGA
jgi:multidrug efflux pump